MSLSLLVNEESQRDPRQKMLAGAPRDLSDLELLSMILRTRGASSRRTSLEQAQTLLAHFHSLHNLERAGMAELCTVPGIGLARASTLKAALELGRRLTRCSLERGDKFLCSRDVYQAYAPLLAGREQETFWVLLLDNRNRVIKHIQIAEGNLWNCPVHPREVFTWVLREAAANLILIHNHPSGDPAPSTEDQELTERLRQAGELFGIQILDHLVIGDGVYTSFADRGLL